MKAGTFEVDEVAFLKSRASDFDVFVNVGANVGYFTLLAASLGRKVIAVEASSKNASRLLENITLNKFSGIEVFPVACGDKPGVLDMYGHGVVASLVPGWSGSSRKPVCRVPVHTLDRLAGNAIAGARALFFIDVEGFELEVLQGASSCLASEPKPVWLVEVCLTEHQPDPQRARERFRAVFAIFQAAGYSASALDQGLHPVDFVDLLAQGDLAKLGSLRNFVFTPV